MKYLYYILVTILVLGGTLTTLAQERKIREEDLKKLIAIAAEKREGISHRQSVITTGYGPGDRSETVYEFGPDDTFHVISTRKSNGIETKTETIRIGTIRYDRKKDGTWLKIDLSTTGTRSSTGGGMGSGGGVSSGKVESTKEHLFLRTEKIGKQKTNHFRTTTRVVFLSGTPVRTRHAIYDYWFREDGMLVREMHEDGFENSRQRYKRVTEYAYDKDIKIVAPIP